jgi:hypothetical protein
MRREIFIVFCQFGIFLSHQAMLDNEVIVGVLVEQLADVVENEWAKEVLMELARVLSICSKDRNIFTREIWSLLKKMKDRKGKNERIIPQEIVKLLKAKLKVGEKIVIH